MFCKRCGAELRDTDQFCSQCGAPVNDGAEEPLPYNERYKDWQSEERVYRDSFLEKREEKSHALLMTVTILLVMAVVTTALLVFYFFAKKKDAPGNPEDITIITETANAAGNVQTVPEPQAEALTEAQKEVRTEALTEAQTEAPTEGRTEPQTEAPGLVDVKRINDIIAADSTAAKAAVYVYDLNARREYAAGNSEEAMYASALISVPILYTAAVKLDSGEITLNDELTYVNSIGGRGEAYPEEKDGRSFPLSYYLTAMMSYSDNNCMNCLIDYLGLDGINSTCQGAGFSSVDIQRKIVAEVTDGKDNYVSAKDLAGMLRELYGGKFQTIGNEFVKKYFKIDMGDGYRTLIGLASDLPSDVLFLNQNGRGDTRYNEVALISGASCQYIISIMCNGDYGFQYETAVENISNYVYQSLNQ